MDFVKSVLDVLGGRVASDCAYAGVVVLLAKGVYPAEGEGDAMNAAEPLRSSTLVMHHSLFDGPNISLIGYGYLAASHCTPSSCSAAPVEAVFTETSREAFFGQAMVN